MLIVRKSDFKRASVTAMSRRERDRFAELWGDCANLLQAKGDALHNRESVGLREVLYPRLDSYTILLRLGMV